MKELNVGIVACASMHKQIEEYLASLEGSFRIYPIIPSCTFTVKIDLFRHYLDRSTTENDVTILAYGICHPQILPLLAEYGDSVVKVEGCNCFEMFLGSEKYGEYHRKCYWMLNKPFFTRWKDELLTGYGAGTSSGRALIGDTFKKLVYLRFEKDELSEALIADFARTVGLEYEIHSAETANLKRLLDEALASAYSTGRVKIPKPSVHYPRESEMRTMVKSIGEVIYKVDIHTKQFTFVSPQVKRILGYTPSEFLDIMNGYLQATFCHEDDRQQVVAGRYRFLVRCLNEGMQEPYEAEYRAKHKKGDGLWVKESIYPSYSPDGIIESFVGKIVDITESKRAEEEMRESEQKLRFTFESIDEGVCITDLYGKFTQVNEAMVRLHGYDNKEEILGRNASEFIAEKDLARARENLKRALKVGSVKDVEYTFLRRDSSEFDAELSINVLRNTSSKIVGFVATLSDIARRKRAEEEVREERDKAQKYLDIAGVVLIVIGADQKVNLVNKKGCEILGFKEKEIIGKNWFDTFIPERNRDEVRVVLEKLMAGKAKPVEYFENPVLTKSGEERIIAWHNTVLTDEAGNITGTLSSGEDITKRKKAEEELRQSEENFRAGAANASDGIVIIASNGEIRYANRRAAQITGYSRQYLSRSHINYHIHPDELKRVTDRLNRRLSGRNTPINYETLFVRKDRSSVPVELAAAKTTWQGEPAVQVIFRDISEQKQLRESMQFYVAEVTRVQEAERKRIARELHDETAQSLAVLSLEIEAMNREEQLSEGAIQRLNQLKAKTDSILEGVRRFSQELRPEVLDQLGLIPALELLTKGLNEAGNINAWVEVIGSERRLSTEAELVLFRITQEALRNVWKHSQATEAAVRVEFTPKKVKVSITDNGKGFKLPKVPGELASAGKMGLISMHERARLLNGGFLLKSKANKGTTAVVEVAE